MQRWMASKALRACALVALLGACQTENALPEQWQAINIFIRGSTTAAQTSACLDAIKAVVLEWNTHETKKIPACSIEVLFGKKTDCGQGTAGCALIGKGRIQVVGWYKNYEWSCPALYHEFAHLTHKIYHQKDPRKEDPRWAGWNAIGWNLGLQFARPDLPDPK